MRDDAKTWRDTLPMGTYEVGSDFVGPDLLSSPLPLDAAADVRDVPRRRYERERAARKSAERLLDEKSRELFGALRQARESEHRLQLALWASGEGIWEWSAHDNCVALDRFEIEGRRLQWGRRPFADLLADVHPDDHEAMRLGWMLHLNGSRSDLDIAYRLHHEGVYRWVRVRGRALERDGQGIAMRVTGTLKDITHQRESEESLRLMAHAFSSTRDALVVVDANWRIVEANSAFCVMLRQTMPQVLSRSLQEFVDLGDLALDSLLGEGTWRGEKLVVCASHRVPVDVSVTAVTGPDARKTCLIVALHDISERKQAEARLERLAMHDPVTGLPNRAALEAHLDAMLRDGAQGKPFGLLFLDLDGFKVVNDSFGHEAGDGMLCQVALRLREALPPNTFIGRWGGDEFAVVMPEGSSEEALRQAAEAAIDCLRKPFAAGASEVSVGTSVGAVMAPRDGTVPGTLLRRVDAAMYAAKERGRNRAVFYDPSFETDARRRVRLLSQLRTDADRDGFRFAAQPKVNAEGTVVGAEILMRWATEAFGAVSPVEFIPLAEQVGLIHLLGRHAMHAAARLAARLRELGHALPIAVNLSPRQLQAPGVEEMLLAACKRFDVPPSAIELEITESAFVHSMQIVQPLLQRLHDAGFVLALDDFGTGYSSLSYLRHLPFDKIKIDRSFVMDVHRDPRAARLLDSIVHLCDVLQMRTVAEGVESREQYDTLREMGVHEFQGYYFSKPVFVHEWVDRLRDPSRSGWTLPQA